MKKINKFYLGVSSFGLCVGLFVGMSVSPIVNSVVSLLFAFIGGSIIFLIKGRSEDELAVIGSSVFFISVFMIIGAFSGVSARDGFSSDSSSVSLNLGDEKFYEFIKRITDNKIDARNICVIVKKYNENVKISEISISELEGLASKVDPLVLSVMLNGDVGCFSGDVAKASGSGVKLNEGE